MITSCPISNQFSHIDLVGVLRRFQHCTGHIIKVVGRVEETSTYSMSGFCTVNCQQLPAFPLEAVPGTEPQPQRWEARVLPF